MIIISVLTIILRIAAAVLSLLMIKITGRRWVWIAFAFASVIKLVKDVPGFIERIINPAVGTYNLMTEIQPLLVSGLVLVGVFWVYFLFKSINKSEAALEENNHFLNSIFHGMQDSLVLIDRNYRIQKVNSRFETDYMDGDEVFPGKYCYQVIHNRTTPCDGSDHPCPMDTVFNHGKSVAMEHIHKDLNGNDIYL